MKYDKSEIMRYAHMRHIADKKRNPGKPLPFREYLKMAWFEARYDRWYYATHASDEEVYYND